MSTRATRRGYSRAPEVMLVVLALVAGGGARADEPRAAEAPVAAAPAPYSLPWQLRSALAVTALRIDTAVASYENQLHNRGVTVATMILGSYKVTPELAPFVRLGVVGNSPPTGTTGGGAVALVNPAIGATYALKLGQDFRLALFLGLAIPVGAGGGDSPDAGTAAAVRSGVLARSAMDNAMFAVNYFTVFPGIGFAYVAHGLTVQAEMTLFRLMRVRGEAVERDSSKTNFTAGLHVGYFVLPELSLGAEIRHQRWLSSPAGVSGPLWDNTSFAAGARLHLRAGESIWLRPGIAYARGLDDPMANQGYHIVQVDLPVVF